MRKVTALIGASLLVLATAAPALAGGTCPPPPDCSEGIQITISVNGLGGHDLEQLADSTSKVTICHVPSAMHVADRGIT